MNKFIIFAVGILFPVALFCLGWNNVYTDPAASSFVMGVAIALIVTSIAGFASFLSKGKKNAV